MVSGSRPDPSLIDGRELGHPLQDVVVDRAVHEHPAAGRAHLALVAEHAHRRSRHRSVEVGVGEHDVGALAAEFERDPLELIGARALDVLADRLRPGERDLVDTWMGQQRLPRLVADPGDDVEHPGRNTRLLGDLGHLAAPSVASVRPA